MGLKDKSDSEEPIYDVVGHGEWRTVEAARGLEVHVTLNPPAIRYKGVELEEEDVQRVFDAISQFRRVCEEARAHTLKQSGITVRDVRGEDGKDNEC